MPVILRTIALLLMMSAITSWPAQPQTADPPRRIARLAYVAGSVTFQPIDSQNATPAEVNRPFSSGDSFWSGSLGRGELQTENAAIRFSSNTRLVIRELSNQATIIGLMSGTIKRSVAYLGPQRGIRGANTAFSLINFSASGSIVSTSKRRHPTI